MPPPQEETPQVPEPIHLVLLALHQLQSSGSTPSEAMGQVLEETLRLLVLHCRAAAGSSSTTTTAPIVSPSSDTTSTNTTTITTTNALTFAENLEACAAVLRREQVERFLEALGVECAERGGMVRVHGNGVENGVGNGMGNGHGNANGNVGVDVEVEDEREVDIYMLETGDAETGGEGVGDGGPVGG